MHGNFSLTSFILGNSEDPEDIFFDNLDIKKEKDFLQADVTTSQMPVPDYNQAIYSYRNFNGTGSNLSSPVSLPSPMMEVSPAHSPAHMVPTTDDYGRHGLRYSLHTKRTGQAYGSVSKLHGKRRKRDEELSFDELEKRRVRRERNKEAALRCRTRRRERIEALEKETAELEEMNEDAEKEISSLKTQLDQLQQMLAEHQCTADISDFSLSGTVVKEEPDF